MRAIMAGLTLAAALVACGPRQVEVQSQPSATTEAELGVHMTNNLSQPVNVYVVTGGSDVFLKQVAANSTEHLPVRGVAAGANVRLRATTADGTRTYSKDNVTLTSAYAWTVP